ncbi:MAG: hypothetical protein ACP5E3_11940 [Bacteroidales bacterium]
MSSVLKYSSLLIFVLLLQSGLSLFAQEKNLYFYYDSLTYAQYNQENWSGLIKSSRKAFKNDIDYYYLRMRAGIANYESGNYLLAERQFKKALKMNNIDPVSKEYIYYSKLFAGKDKEASLFYGRNREYLENKLNSKNKAVRSFMFDLAYHFNFEDKPGVLFNLEKFYTVPGNQTVTRNFFYGSFLLQHDISRYFILTHGGSLLRKYNYYFSASPELILDSYEHRINQNQYYVSLGFYPGADFNINASLHYINLVSPSIVYRQRGFGTIYSIPGLNENYWLSRISAYKYFHLFRIGAGVSWSDLNNNEQLQKDAHLIFYPLGNRNLYTTSSFYHITETGSLKKTHHPVFQQGVGFKVLDNLWVESKFLTGELKNAATGEGFVIYNGNETVTSRLDLNLIIPDEKFTLSINSSYLEYYSSFVDPEGNVTSFNDLKFKGLTLIAEIKWNF